MEGARARQGQGEPIYIIMVKSLTAIGIAVALLLGLAILEWYFVNSSFSDFREELEILYDKADAGTANGEDAKLVQDRWERRKEQLHIWIPHNDISRIDDYMSEAVRLIAEKDYELALPKLEILIHLSECLPDTYKPAVENIF